MLRTVWLTYRMHRFEVLLSVALLAVVAVSAVVAAQHILATLVPSHCLLVEAAHPDPVCDAIYAAADPAQRAGAIVMGAMAVIPVGIGLVLGVAIVAREVELRTLSFAWALSPSRRRWLLSRLLPMLAVVMIGLVLVGLATIGLAEAQATADARGLNLDDMGNHGPVMVSRGLMALGIGLLAGALTGRTLPGLLVGAVLMFAWVAIGAPMLRQAQVPSRLVWVTDQQRDRDHLGGLAYQYAPNYGSWYLGPDGSVMTERDVETAGCGADYSVDQPTSAQQQCLDNLEMPPAGYSDLWHLVPDRDYPEFELVETVVGLLIGGVAILLTFPVVQRRRPT